MSLATASLIPLSGVDPALVEQLLDRAFGPDRHKRTAYKVREGTQCLPALSFAALDQDDMLVGTIQAFPVALTDPAGRPHPMLMIGPVAVLPERQGEGFGRALMAAQAGALDPASPLPQMLIGDADYYARFGFSADHTAGWKMPGPWEPERLLARSQNPAILPREGMLGPWKG
ncbi:N-acetyltransferase [Alteraurantiacibacter aestuarii]|uniref:GNAT family N-acetyltransferase n=1 Tax=Alteraurantiacibacter aestuarii TaxID=650004 RepID=UPI0031D97D37